MDVRPLRHFIAVAETLHFGRAAERLGLSQPPLSQSIQKLERSLGTKLFERTKRKVELTSVGSQWLPIVRDALAAIEALPAAAQQLHDGEAGCLDLSFVSMVDYSILPAVVRQYAALYPKVKLRLTEATTDVQIEALLGGRSDVGIIVGSDSTKLPDVLDYRALLREPLLAAIPQRWIDNGRITLRRDRVAGANLAQNPLILFPRHVSPAFHDLVFTYLSPFNPRPQVVQEAIQMQTIVSLISAEMGVGLVPSSISNLQRPGVKYVNLDEATPPTLETGIAWRRLNTSPTLLKFITISMEQSEMRV